jgi:hypothetical protein
MTACPIVASLRFLYDSFFISLIRLEHKHCKKCHPERKQNLTLNFFITDAAHD